MASEVWTIKRILDWTSDYLGRKDDEHPRLSAEWLLCNATGHTRVELYINYDKPLSAGELDIMRDGVRRRAAGEPLQYVTGEMPFRHIVLRCEKGVLIPRPETEILVDVALEALDECGSEAPLVLEVGTGTGCIALSLASEHEGARVIATDLSPMAVRLAVRNRDALNLAGVVDVVECDLAVGVPNVLMGRFNVLVSNPPYIPTEVLVREVPAEVKDHEPGLALDGGEDGLDVFRRILAIAPEVLAQGGTLCVELFEGNVHAAAELVRAEPGWANVEVREDLTHRPRVLIARRG